MVCQTYFRSSHNVLRISLMPECPRELRQEFPLTYGSKSQKLVTTVQYMVTVLSWFLRVFLPRWLISKQEPSHQHIQSRDHTRTIPRNPRQRNSSHHPQHQCEHRDLPIHFAPLSRIRIRCAGCGACGIPSHATLERNLVLFA